MEFLDLPMGVLRRILFFVCIGPKARDCDKVSGSTTDLLNMLYTCKELYENYIYMAYTMRPLVLKDDSVSLFNLFNLKKYRTHGSKCMKYIGSQRSIRDNTRALNVITSPSLFYRKYKVEEGEAVSEFAEPFKLTRFDLLLHLHLPQFRILHTLNIRGRHIKLLLYFCFLPESLKSISLFIDYKEHSFNNYQELNAILQAIENKSTNAALENFLVYSNNPIMQTRIHSNFYLVKGKPVITYNEYFSTQVVSKYEKYNFRRKKGLVVFGLIMYKLLDKFRNSLKSIELEKVDFALIFNSSIVNSTFRKITYNFHFPTLRLLAVDNISSLKLNTWIKAFQEDNSSFRNDKPLFIVMHDELSGYLHTKTVGSHSGLPRGIHQRWLHSKDPLKTMRNIKLDLDINL